MENQQSKLAMSLQNYRVTFYHSVECDYWGKKKGLQAESLPNFRKLSEIYYPTVRLIKLAARARGIYDIWHFYEPYVEITWYSQDRETSELLFSDIEKILAGLGVQADDIKRFYPKDGKFADWFCVNDREREFGGKVHALCSDFAELAYQYKQDIEAGKGLREQVKRTIHRICNPVGLNYRDEAYICFSRGLICLLFCWFSRPKAVWIYRNIFRQKY